MDKQTTNWYPAIIFGLVAALVSVFALLVVEKSADHSNGSVATQQQNGDQKTYEWKLVTTWPKNFPGLGTAPENFARIIEDVSDGRIKVKVYGAGELVPALAVFGAVSSGSVEMGHGAAYYWKGKVPAAQFFTAIPFGMNAQEMNGWFHYGGGLELWREVYEPFNLVPFSGGSTGVQMAGWFNKEINAVDDLKGLKMRIPGLGGEVLNRAGGSSINIPGGELYTALQTGVIDATEWVGPYNDLAFGFHQVAEYYYYPGWHEPGAMLEFIINKDVYESLPADLQAMVESVTRQVNQDMLDEYTARNNAALIELKNQHGVKVKRLPQEVLDHLQAIAKDIYAETSATDPLFGKVYKAYSTFAEQAADYHLISEEAYYESR
ncbi:TRAP transporter substrate-binding protein DctP [Maricurvus nonylphenolicus]|uniref:TRAP transporter substrate-binding protein n=1 Tax=Maricurvus nonylphenolicus TaxID=1008307 RepID=UPI0036F30B0F